MVVLEDKIYLHFQKTGGLSVYRVIDNLRLKKLWFREHCGIMNLPEEFRHLRRFSFIRNPYEWYVSYYHFHLNGYLNKKEHWINPFLIPLAGDSPDFRKFIKNSCNLKSYFQDNPDRHELLFEIIEEVFRNRPRIWINKWFKDTANVREELSLDNLDMSLMEWYMNVIGLFEDNTTIYKMEHFDESLEKEFGPIERVPHLHTSLHKKYQYYYDTTLVDTVGESHAYVLDKYDYKF